jgi:CelD/BcsL family acetyltransferase involved in cellulose biosynthesis
MSALQTQAGPSVVPVSTVTVRVCRTWVEIEELRSTWELLLRSCLQPSIFQTPEWLASWWQSFGASKKLRALVFNDQAGATVGLALLYSEQQRFLGLPLEVLRFVGAGSGDSDALDFIVTPGCEPACAQAFLTWLAAEPCDVCALETLPENSLTSQHIAALSSQRRDTLYSEETVNLYIDLPATWSGYLETLDPGFRPLLTRYPRRLRSRFRVSIRRCEQEADLVSNLQTLFQLHQMRWTGRGEPGAFSSIERRDFYLRMAHAFQERGWLEFWLLALDDDIVAAQFCFRYGKTVYLLQEGFDPRYAAEKVGYALRAHVLEHMVVNGATRYDFLGGDDSYKRNFEVRTGSYTTLRLPQSLRGRIRLALLHRKQQIKQRLKRILPAFVMAALRRERTGSSPANPIAVKRTECQPRIS